MTLASCNDDNFDIVDDEVVITVPDTVSTIAITGKVTDREGNLLSSAEVSLLHNGIIHSTISEQDGSYAFNDLAAVDDRLEALVQSEDYIETAAVLTVTDKDLTHDFVLIKPEEVTGGNHTTATILSDSLILLSGITATPSGEAVEGAIVLIARQDLTDLQYAVSDADGNWEIATSQRGDFILFAVDLCRQVLQNAQVVTLTDDDLDIGTVDVGNNVYREYNFTGRILDCDTGEEVPGVSISITFEGENNSYQNNLGSTNYDIQANNCSNATCYTIRANSPFGYRDTIATCLPLDGNLNNDIFVCKEALIPDESEGVFNVGGVQLDYDFVSATRENDGWLIGFADPDLTEVAVILTASDSGSGTCTGVAIFENAGTTTYVMSQDQAPQYTIDSVTNNYVYGTMTGTLFEVATRSAAPTNATYKALIQ